MVSIARERGRAWCPLFRGKEVRKMMDPYLPLDPKTGYKAQDAGNVAFILDGAIFPIQVPNYDNT
jgi:hypothetical protein